MTKLEESVADILSRIKMNSDLPSVQQGVIQSWAGTLRSAMEYDAKGKEDPCEVFDREAKELIIRTLTSNNYDAQTTANVIWSVIKGHLRQYGIDTCL